MSRIVFFGVCIAPYRIDLYNYLHANYNADIYFVLENASKLGFDVTKLYSQISFDLKYLTKGRFFYKEIVHILKENEPEVVFVPEFSILALQVILIRKIYGLKFKVISVSDDSYDMIINDRDFSKLHKLGREYMTPFLDDLILSDRKVVDWYAKKFNKGIWFPIILDENRLKNIWKANDISAQIRASYNLKDKKVFLYVGRLEPEKNTRHLLDAFSKLKSNDNILVIIGSGSLQEELKQIASSYDVNTLFLGRIDDNILLYNWYHIADVFVLPSLLEPFGAVTSEALSFDCYSIVSSRAGSSCLIENGENGFVVNPLSVEELVNAMENALYAKDNSLSFVKYPFIKQLEKTLDEIL